MVTRAKRESNNRWDRDNMTVLGCKVKREVADQARAAARQQYTSINAVLRAAIDSLISGDASTICIQDKRLMVAIHDAALTVGMTDSEWIEDLARREIYGD